MEPARNNGDVPQYAKPIDGDALDTAANLFGNRVKTSIIGFLRNNPNSGAKAIVEATGVTRSSVTLRLGELETEGLIVADPPRETRQRGDWPVYRVNDARVTELYLRLGIEIAEM